MKNNEYSPYGTNKGGYIKSPKNEAKGDPKSSVKKTGKAIFAIREVKAYGRVYEL